MIADCDKEIEHFIKRELKGHPERGKMRTTKKPQKRINKNASQIKDLNQIVFRYFDGVDLFAIEGLSHTTVFTIMGEIGTEGFYKFGITPETILFPEPEKKTWVVKPH